MNQNNKNDTTHKSKINNTMAFTQSLSIIIKKTTFKSDKPMKKRILVLTILLILCDFSIFSQNKEINHPRENFEDFCAFFENNYAFFNLRGVDWKNQYLKYLPLITDTTSDKKLFEIMSDMVSPLKDGHVTIKDLNGKTFCISQKTRFNEEFKTQELKDSLWLVTKQTLAKNGFTGIKEMGPKDEPTGSMFYYSKSVDYGYLRIGKFFNEFEFLNNKKKIEEGIDVLQKLLDSLMIYFNSCKGLIVDVRCNPGGYDKYAYTVANRFVSIKQIGHSKCIRNGGAYDNCENEKTYYLEPVSSGSFTKPIMLLTNDQTASAADVFSLITKNIPNITKIGEPSEGIFSDMKFKTLPNSWTVSLSNECYFSSYRICYEGLGVPVDIEILNTKQDLIENKDPLFIRALEELKKK